MTKDKANLKKGVVLMVLAAVGWSLSGVFIKQINMNPFVIAGLRSSIALITTVVFMVVAKIKPIVNRKTVFGGLMMPFVFFLFVWANKLTLAANAIALQNTDPMFLVVFSALFLGQKFHRHDILAVVFTFLGIILFFFGELSEGSLLGNVIAIVSGIALALLFLTVGAITPHERISLLLIGNVITAVVGLPFIIAYPIADVSSTAIMSVAFLGVFQLGIPYILFTLAAKECPVFLCSLIGMLEPLLNPVWVLLFVGEIPGIFAVVGAVVVISTITAWCVYDNIHKQR